MSSVFREWLGAEVVIWIPYGLIEDSDTDGHVDNVVCYSRPGQVLCQLVASKANPNYARLRENYAVLSEAKDAKGRTLDTIPFTDIAHIDFSSTRGRRAVSYLNLYIANGAIVVPVVGAPSDDSAIEALSQVFRNRRVVTAAGQYLAHGGGGVHCVTLGHPVTRVATPSAR